MSAGGPGRHPVAVPAVAAGVLALLGAACKVDVDLGETVTKEITVTEFDDVDIDGPFDVLVEVGQEPGVTVDIHEEIVDRLEIDQDGDHLSIGFSGGLAFTSNETEVTITTPELTRLSLDGAASVDVEDLDGERLVLELDGASSVTGRGSVGVLVIDTDGASSVDFDRVTADTAEIDADGASSIEIARTAAVTGRANGASSIDVADDADVDVSTDGAASVD